MNIESLKLNVPGLSESEQGSLQELLSQWRAKRTRNNLRTGFYDMRNATAHLMPSNVPTVVRRRDFVLGWSRIAVDKLSRRCNLEGFYDTNGLDLDAFGLGQIVRDNRLLSEVAQAGIASLIHAVSFLVTTQGDPAAGEPEVLISARDASTSTGVWDVRRRELSSFLSITKLDEAGEPTALTMYLPNLNLIMSKDRGRWSLERREHTYGVPVDPLRYRPRLGRVFGSSRITRAVMSIHGQALAAMVRADVNGEAYSLPRYVLLGATEEAFQNADGSARPTWQAAWDSVWAIGDDQNMPDALARADVKQFNGRSPEPQNAHLRMLAQMFSGETGIPIGELGIIGDSNPTSAESLAMSKEDLITEAEITTEGWSPDLSRAVTRGITMLNGGAPKELDVQPLWRSPMHTSRAAAADAGTKILDKLPWLAETEVGLELVGLSPDQIRRALAEKEQNSSRSDMALLASALDQQLA